LLRWLDIVEQTPAKYSVEQVLTLRLFLERNPDQRERLRRLVAAGKLEVLGGGETVIDFNMVDGEAIVRNQLYALRWLRAVLDVRPHAAHCPDTFGISAQVPQLFRQLGFLNLQDYQRVFAQRRKFWRGLDGSLLGILKLSAAEQLDFIDVALGGRYEPCGACAGEGCHVCEQSGLDLSEGRRFASQWVLDKLRQSLDQLDRSPHSAAVACLWGEELIDTPDVIAQLETLLRPHACEIVYVNYRDMQEQFFAHDLRELTAGTIAADDIDPRIEANCVGTGCYVSRIRLKQLNRVLEDMLLGAEKCAAFAADHGMLYPRGKIEELWRGMALLQFHDAITGTHVDAAYDELLGVTRQVRLGAAQIYDEALVCLAREVAVPARAGWQSFLMFNHLSWPVQNNVHERVFNLAKHETARGIELESCSGQPLRVLSVETLSQKNAVALRVQFTGLELPSLGYAAVYYRLAATVPEPPVSVAAQWIENEFYRIEYDSTRITRVLDRHLDVVIGTEKFGALEVEQDIGSPWETLATPYFNRCLHDEEDTTVMVQQIAGGQRLSFAGQYRNMRAGHIQRLCWRQEVTLLQGVRKMFFKTTSDWDARNARLKVLFPVGFTTPDHVADYEIPYGVLRRPAYKAEYGYHLCANGDWPTLNFISCYNQPADYSVTVFNRGLPANRFVNGVIHLSLLRCPGEALFAYDIEGALEKGTHVFEYAVTSHQGDYRAGDDVRQGKEYNATFMACEAMSHDGALPPVHSFLRNRSKNVILAAVKRAEDDGRLVVRAYETNGAATVDELTPATQWAEANLLEEDATPVKQIAFAPFEVKTLLHHAAPAQTELVHRS